MTNRSMGRRARLRAAALVALAAAISAAVAGPRYNVPGVVRISDDGAGKLVVEGTLGEVRNSANDAHRLMCQQSRSETINSAGTVSRVTSVICSARNAERAVACISSSESIANALNGASNDALIELHITGASCTNIIVYESSGLIRKKLRGASMNIGSGFAPRAALLGLAAICVGSAFAGSKFTGNGQVQITKNADGSGSASAYLGMIYNMTDNNEWFGCQKSSVNVVFCHAKNVGQVVVDCWATSAYLANAVSSISPDARVSFRFDSQGRCTNITVTHSSEYEDKR